MPEKFYSVEEANALVPKLKPLLERIRATQEALARDKTVAAVREKASHNGGGLPRVIFPSCRGRSSATCASCRNGASCCAIPRLGLSTSWPSVMERPFF